MVSSRRFISSRHAMLLTLEAPEKTLVALEALADSEQFLDMTRGSVDRRKVDNIISAVKLLVLRGLENRRCPHIEGSEEGTQWCNLAVDSVRRLGASQDEVLKAFGALAKRLTGKHASSQIEGIVGEQIQALVDKHTPKENL